MEIHDLGIQENFSKEQISPNNELSTQTMITYVESNEIKKYLNLLEQSTGSDKKVCLEAKNTIEKAIISDIIKSLLIFSEIILQEGVDNSLVYLSMEYIKKAFTPIPPITEDFISEKWEEIDSSIHTRVKTAILRGLSFSDSKITTISSETFITLLNIEKIDMFDIIPSIFNLYETAKNSEHTRLTAINLLKEISGKNLLGSHTEYEEVEIMLSEIFKKIIFYFQNFLTETDEVKMSVADAIETFLDVEPNFFEDQDLSNSILDTIYHNITITEKPKYHGKLLLILFKLIKIQYKNTDFNPEKLLNYINEQILEFNENSNSDGMLENYIEFWYFMSKYEFEIIQINEKKKNIKEQATIKFRQITEIYDKQEVMRNFTSIAIRDLPEKLISFLSMINPDDTSSEKKGLRMPHSCATVCLLGFFKIDPMLIYTKIENFWRKILEVGQTDNWITYHTLVLTFLIIFQQINLTESFLILRKIKKFFFEPYKDDFIIFKDFVLKRCLTDFNVPKIIDTCLYSFGQIMLIYPEIYNENDYIYDIVFNWIKENMETKDQILFTRICHFLIRYSQISILQNKIKIPEEFDDILKVFQIGISQQDLDHIEKINASYLMMENIIRFIINLKNNSDKSIISINELIKSQIMMLKECNSRDEFTIQKITYIVSLISKIYSLSYRPEIFNENLNPLFDILKQIMSDPNSIVFEKCINFISSFYLGINNDNNNYNILSQFNLINEIGLSSNKENVVTCSALNMSYLYFKLVSNQFEGYLELIDKFQQIYKKILSFLQTFKKEHFPDLLRSLSYLISACENVIKNDYLKFNDDFIEVIKKLAEINISVSDDQKSIEFANDFYSSIFGFVELLLKCITNKNMDNGLMRLLYSFTSKYLNDLRYRFSDSSLISFADYLNALADTSYRNKIIVLRRSTYEILFHGICSKNKRVKNTYNDLLNKINNI